MTVQKVSYPVPLCPQILAGALLMHVFSKELTITESAKFKRSADMSEDLIIYYLSE